MIDTADKPMIAQTRTRLLERTIVVLLHKRIDSVSVENELIVS